MSERESQRVDLQIGRRNFLKSGALGATGLLIGCYLPELEQAHAADTAVANSGSSAGRVALNAWIHVSPDDTVTIFIDKSEMGQSTVTGLAMIAADELECDWQKVRTEFAPADKVYFNPQFGAQGTGASTATRTSWEPLRKAGAAARIMLVQAEAQKWGVPPSECQSEKGTITHAATGRRTSYGSAAVAAGNLPVPQEIPLKDPREFRIIGKPTRRLDTPDKVSGHTEFGIDVRRENMLYAVVARCPVFGGKVASFDATKAKAIPGVKTC
jgi:isoquinoline 1-oxidoreductase subunit beta